MKRLEDKKLNLNLTKKKFELQTINNIEEDPEIIKLKEECGEIQEKCAKELEAKIVKSNMMEQDTLFKQAAMECID